MQSDLHIPVIVVDDQAVMRLGLKIALERIAGVKVVGEAALGREAIEQSTTLRPAIVFMDMSMPDMDGIEATEAIKNRLPETRIIMLTSSDDEGIFLSALEAGADGYCLKDATEKQLEGAIYGVLQGAKWLDSGLSARVLSGRSASVHRLDRSLISAEQKKIFELIEQGLNINQIAATMGGAITEIKISLRTAVDCLQPDSMLKATRVMSNLRPMIDDSDVTADKLGRQIKERKVGAVISEKYRIEKVLGKGGMSVVYLARHVVLGKLVAIKMMHHNLVATGSSLKRFEREARIASSLDHPGIVGVHDFGEDENGQPYLIMDYVSGDTLDELIEQAGKLDADFCIPVFVQICEALRAMHGRGIVHRDLKPSNVIVKIKSAGPQVTLVDLGIARSIVESSSSARLTVAGQMFGSPTFMSPEQCIGQDADYRSDLYSFGCLMYDALAGSPPFLDESSYNVMWQHVNEPPARLPFLEQDRSVPGSLEAIIFKLLHKDPDHRYQSADQLWAALQSLLQLR